MSERTINIRGSAGPRISRCPASAVPPKIVIDTTDEAAAMGSAGHDAIQETIQGLEPDLTTIAAAWNIDDVDELDRLHGIARSMWGRLEANFPNAIVEHEFEPHVVGPVTFTGKADLLSLSDDGSTIRILDWKFGWGDFEHKVQVQIYAYLALQEMPTADRVTVSVLKVRRGDIETWEFTRSELVEWAESFAQRVAREIETFRPSVEACGYCPRGHECPARAAMLRQAIAVVDEAANTETSDLASHESALTAPDKLLAALDFAKAVEKWAKLTQNLVKAQVQLAGGSVMSADGRELRVTETVRTEIDFAAGAGVLHKSLGNRIGEALKVVKGDAVKVVRDAAPRGEKQRAEEQFLYELDQAGALKLSASPRLEVIKAAKQIEVTA